MIVLPNGSPAANNVQVAEAIKGMLVGLARDIFVRQVVPKEGYLVADNKGFLEQAANRSFDAASAFMARAGIPCELTKPEKPPCGSSDPTKAP